MNLLGSMSAPRAQRRESCELSFSSRKQKCPEGSGLLFSPLLRLCRLCRRGPYGSAGDLGFCFEPIFYVMAFFTTTRLIQFVGASADLFFAVSLCRGATECRCFFCRRVLHRNSLLP